MKHRLLLALLAILCAGLLAVPARAQQQSQATLEARAGYDGNGRYRVGHWFPVQVVATNDGPDTQATVTLRFPGDEQPTFAYALDLPRGARKAVMVPAVTGDSDRSVRVDLLAGTTELARVQVRLDPLMAEEVAVGVISSDPGLLGGLAAAQIAPNLPTVVTHLTPDLLPEDAALLAGLDVIMIHDLATAGLSDGQRAALALWTRLGGQLVVGGGVHAEQTAPGLDALLPVAVGATRPNVSTAGLGALAGRADLATSVPTLSANTVEPRPGATALDQDGLLTAWELGAGQVVFAAFDLAALRTWGGEAELWANVLRVEPRMAMGASFRWRGENLLRDALELPGLQLPSTGMLLLLMATYIVVVGPVNFLLLRRLKRAELAWVTTPLLVLGFTALAYGASFALRGTRPTATALTIVQSFEGSPGAQATSFQAIFSPQRRGFRLDFDPAALVTPGTLEGFQLVGTTVTSDGASTGVRDLLIDVSSLRTLLVEEPTTRAPEVGSDLQVDRGSGVSGEVRLTGAIGLRDAMVVYGDDAQELGDLRPGDAASVQLRTGAQNFPDQVTPAAGGIINRGQVLNALFGYDRFTRGGPTFQGEKGIPELDGVYLLGWSTETTVAGRIDGQDGQRQGETLYIIRLGQ